MLQKPGGRPQQIGRNAREIAEKSVGAPMAFLSGKERGVAERRFFRLLAASWNDGDGT
jgi:hypothetical protein